METVMDMTAIVIIHEIYGINRHISDMHMRFEEMGFDVYCMDFYKGRAFGYKEAEAAYSYFMENVGFEKARKVTLELLKSIRCKYKKVYLVGYSIGAAVAWLCSEEPKLLDGIAGYYGSRIRDYLDITPQVETLLFFPTYEKGFDVDELTARLKCKEKVNSIKYEGLHGFADPYSDKFNSKSKEISEKLLIEFISK